MDLESVESSEEEIPGSSRSMHGYIYRPAPDLKGRTFELWVLNKWVFKFCVRSTSLRVGGGGGGEGGEEEEKRKEKEEENLAF